MVTALPAAGSSPSEEHVIYRWQQTRTFNFVTKVWAALRHIRRNSPKMKRHFVQVSCIELQASYTKEKMDSTHENSFTARLLIYQ
jgi:hypothetical protein